VKAISAPWLQPSARNRKSGGLAAPSALAPDRPTAFGGAGTFDDPGFGQVPESACCPGSNSGIPSRIPIPKNFPGIPQTLMRNFTRRFERFLVVRTMPLRCRRLITSDDYASVPVDQYQVTQRQEARVR
jgi:hypothetical protein